MHQRVFTPYEVAQHNTPFDCWVSIFDKVFDLSDLIKNGPGNLTKPLIQNAGHDLSHWFDEETGDVKTFIDPESGLCMPYCPQGRFVHIPPPYPCSDFDMSFSCPWWKDRSCQIGQLSQAPRVILMKNTLTEQEDKIEVCEEETLAEIRRRYLAINRHAGAYGMKSFVKDKNGKWTLQELKMHKTLTQNGIPNEAASFEEIGMDHERVIPTILVYWMDDLTAF